MKLNKNNKIFTVIMSLLMFVGALSFTSCDKDDDKGEGSAVVLKSFGPSPALRGGELRFIGNNLDKVKSVFIPGAGDISEITVIGKKEIKITIPQDSEPGKVQLTTDKETLETKTELTFSEPISIDKVSPLNLKAGQVLTIEGDYLNLINEVIFNGDSISTDFKSKTRKKLEVVVPIYAQSGKIRISNGAEIPIIVYSEEDLNITLPSFTSVTPNPVKPGLDIVIEGKDFDLVEYIILPGGEKIEGDKKDKITIKTPLSIKEGPVTLVAFSGVEIESKPLDLIKPTISAISSTSVKNGSKLTITGKNLDLVSEVNFPNSDPVTEFDEATPEKIVLTIPDVATAGAFTINTLSDTPINGAELAYIMPETTEITPGVVKAKQTIVIKGTNLDVVSEVVFGSVKGEIKESSEKELTVAVPVGAVSGAITLITTNGTEIITPQEIIVDVTLPVITSITSSGIGEIITIEGTDLNLIKEIYFADEEGNYTINCTAFGIKSDVLVEFYHVKGSATGSITPIMITHDGDEGLMPAVYCGGADPVAPDAIMYFDFTNGSYPGWMWGGFGDVVTEDNGNTYSKVGSGQIGDGAFTWFFADNASGRQPINDLTGKVFKFDIKTEKDFVPGNYKIQWLLGGSWGWCTAGHFPLDENGVFTTGGGWITITLDFSTIGVATIGEGDYGLACQLSDFDWDGIYIDNVRIENK